MRILAGEEKANGGIFNFGNPASDLSIRELAEKLKSAVAGYPGYEEIGRRAQIVDVSAADYYGPGYQDIATRVPSIRRAKEILGWEPKVDFDTALQMTLDFYLTGRKPPVP